MSTGIPPARDANLAGARVALLTNFVAPFRVPLFQMLAESFGALRVFISTPMEPNRAWPAEWGDLDVELLPTLSLRRSARHPHAFTEPLFVHLPYGALFRLWRFRPDVVISGQLGLASTLAAVYCRMRRRSALVLWLTLSEVSELGRGWVRRTLRRWLLARADAIMVNGDSGARYATAFGVPESKIFRIFQTVDLAKFRFAAQREGTVARRLLFVGSGEPRKGLGPFLEHLVAWAEANPKRPVELWIAGTSEDSVEEPHALPANLVLRWLGNVPYERMPDVYADAGILAFPTLADEWGLVVNEAMAAGLPILGSRYSQAVEELVVDGATGWTFRPDNTDECAAAIDGALRVSDTELATMRAQCRERIGELDFEAVTARMLQAVRHARQDVV